MYGRTIKYIADLWTALHILIEKTDLRRIFYKYLV